MKKKKLKKKIKKLRSDIKWVVGRQRELARRENMDAIHIISCKEAITKIENDNKYYKEWIDTAPCYRCTNSKGENEKTCDTCKWKPLMEQGGQDIPCMGCTADDKKMWKSNEEQNNGN